MGFIHNPDREAAGCHGGNRTELVLVRRSLHRAGRVHIPRAATGRYRYSSVARLSP